MKTILLLLGLASSSIAQAQTPRAAAPADSGQYSAWVKGLEAGQVDLDYRAFRESYLLSKEFLNAEEHSDLMDDRNKALRAAMRANDHAEVIKAANGILRIDYTDMLAHKALQQTYKAMGDSAEYRKHHAIEFGLLNSIIHSGDGKTCATGWHVVQISEEYFILGILGAQLKQQSLATGDPSCDRMDVHTDEGDRTYYFEINKVLEMEKKLFQGH